MNKEELTFEIGACHGRVNELEKENAEIREKYHNLTDASIQLAHVKAKETIELREEIERLKTALAETIRRPLGVVPDSAFEWPDAVQKAIRLAERGENGK